MPTTSNTVGFPAGTARVFSGIGLVRLAGCLSAAIAGLLVLPLAAGAQSLGANDIGHPTEIVSWTFEVEADTASISDESGLVLLKLLAEIDGDWKMYALDSPRPSRGVEISLDDLPEGIAIGGETMQTAPKRGFDQNFSIDVSYFLGSAAFAVPLRVASDAGGEGAVRGTVTFQICSDSRGLCLPPTPQAFEVPVAEFAGCLSAAAAACEAAPLDLDALLDGTGAAATSDAATSDAATSDAGTAAPALVFEVPGASPPADQFPTGRGWSGFVLLALAAGFGALLTPCVFPMLPLTVSYFTKHTQSRARSTAMASLFGAAIVATFTALGMVMAVVVGAAGAQTIAANPWVNVFIALVLIGFALSLIGFYEIRLPNSWVNVADRRSREGGSIGGVLFMALTLTLVSFSCTAPFVGGLLAAAAGGSWARPIIGMIVFSAAFASPFVLLAMFPRMLESLPRSGSWMNAVKVSLGFIELAAAIKFLSNADLVWGWNLISRPLAIAVTVVLMAATGAYLLGWIRMPHERRGIPVGWKRRASGVFFLAFGAYLVPGILGAQRTALDPYFPPRRAGDIAILAPERGGGAADEGWIVDNLEQALAEAVRVGQPVFVDFTGYSCTNCRQMESSVFPRPEIADVLESSFVRLKLYTDGREHGPDLQRYQITLTGTVALPTYAIVSPDGELIERVSGTLSASEMAGFLNAGLRAHQTGTIASANR